MKKLRKPPIDDSSESQDDEDSDHKQQKGERRKSFLISARPPPRRANMLHVFTEQRPSKLKVNDNAPAEALYVIRWKRSDDSETPQMQNTLITC